MQRVGLVQASHDLLGDLLCPPLNETAESKNIYETGVRGQKVQWLSGQPLI